MICIANAFAWCATSSPASCWADNRFSASITVLASLIRDILCFTPLALILPAVMEKAEAGSGINGILFAAPISDLVAIVVILALTVPFFRQLKKQEEAQSV